MSGAAFRPLNHLHMTGSYQNVPCFYRSMQERVDIARNF
ncbi:hypothetical protein WG66_007712, partial [Moniliophthora roreri]